MQRDGPKSSVDLETPQVTGMDNSVMSVHLSNPDGSGSSSGSRFALLPTKARPITIGGPDSGARRLGSSPSSQSHVESEPEQPRSRIMAREGAGSASTNIYFVTKTEPGTFTTHSLMNRMEEESPSLSPVSTPKAPPLDQDFMIREDLQRQGERPIEGCRADPRISFRETAVPEDRKSFDSIHSTSLEVSQLQSHTESANKDDGRMKPGQQTLFQEVHQMLEFPSGMEIGRDGKLGEGIIHLDCALEEESSPDTARGLQGPELTLHVDILLAQRALRDAMEGEGVGFPDQSCLLSASECGEEAVDSNSKWSDCGLDRKNSTRSVFDWGYA